MGCVYKATNKINGKIYIGMTTKTLKHRKKQHLYVAKAGKTKYAFQVAIWTHGEKNFKWDIIFKSDDRNELMEKEAFFIRGLKSYIDKFGYNGNNGVSEEDRKKRRQRELLLLVNDIIDKYKYSKHPFVQNVVIEAIRFKKKIKSGDPFVLASEIKIRNGKMSFVY
jgi:group I intron endonuclease